MLGATRFPSASSRPRLVPRASRSALASRRGPRQAALRAAGLLRALRLRQRAPGAAAAAAGAPTPGGCGEGEAEHGGAGGLGKGAPGRGGERSL